MIADMEQALDISKDKSRLDTQLICDFLGTTYWAENIPIEVVKKSIENSTCFGVYENGKQIGFARVISDLATIAYLADVFIIPEEQGRGLGINLIKAVLKDPEFVQLRRWHLVTKDAQPLYTQCGFTSPEFPERHMEIKVLGPYIGK
ncbi:MAG: N-acetylglutamate synthase-like GNAT family acetyltransferase [Candidatus Marinamargulisbacteria bacterium]|jgi:N-acetylglutamate synthase-like GNAT family acetyltransferase